MNAAERTCLNDEQAVGGFDGYSDVSAGVSCGGTGSCGVYRACNGGYGDRVTCRQERARSRCGRCDYTDHDRRGAKDSRGTLQRRATQGVGRLGTDAGGVDCDLAASTPPSCFAAGSAFRPPPARSALSAAEELRTIDE